MWVVRVLIDYYYSYFVTWWYATAAAYGRQRHQQVHSVSTLYPKEKYVVYITRSIIYSSEVDPH